MRLSCWALLGDHNCAPFPASVTITRAEIGLEDVVAPIATATGGALAGTAPVRGTAALTFDASDQGGGVYRASLIVDGYEVARKVVDANGGLCADVEPSNTDPYEFASPQPCPLTVSGSIGLNSATLKDGRHHIVVTVEDAAGNSAVAFDGHVTTHNAPVNVVAPAVGGSAKVGARLTASAGQWDGAPTDWDYRWLRCDAQGNACAAIAGASGPSYDVTAADAYHRLRVEVTAANASGAVTARSSASAVIADQAGATSPGSGTAGQPPKPGAIDGLTNPLGNETGRVANGAGADAGARLTIAIQRAGGGTVKRLRTRYGRRVVIVGRLTDAAGRGIAQARLNVALRTVGKRWVARPGVTTGHDGRFVLSLPVGPSRAVRLAYFPFSDSSSPRLSNVVHVDVRAPLTIAADRQRVSGSRVVRLSGRLGGGAVPRGGALVTLHGWQAGWGWRPFRTVRTDSRGRWSTRYRFRLSSGRFGFRAVLPRQPGVPFANGVSRAVYVVVS